jgi:hypothetical protein
MKKLILFFCMSVIGAELFAQTPKPTNFNYGVVLDSVAAKNLQILFEKNGIRWMLLTKDSVFISTNGINRYKQDTVSRFTGPMWVGPNSGAQLPGGSGGAMTRKAIIDSLDKARIDSLWIAFGRFDSLWAGYGKFSDSLRAPYGNFDSLRAAYANLLDSLHAAYARLDSAAVGGDFRVWGGAYNNFTVSDSLYLNSDHFAYNQGGSPFVVYLSMNPIDTLVGKHYIDSLVAAGGGGSGVGARATYEDQLNTDGTLQSDESLYATMGGTLSHDYPQGSIWAGYLDLFFTGDAAGVKLAFTLPDPGYTVADIFYEYSVSSGPYNHSFTAIPNYVSDASNTLALTNSPNAVRVNFRVDNRYGYSGDFHLKWATAGTTSTLLKGSTLVAYRIY